MTDLSPPEAPQPGESQPGDGASPTERGSLPLRKPFGESLPQRGGSLFERSGSSSGYDDPGQQGDSFHAHNRADASAPSGEVLARLRDALIDSDDTLPRGGDPVTRDGATPSPGGWQLPRRAASLPQRAADLGDGAAPLPQRGAQPDLSGSLPQRGAPLPQRGAQPDPAGSLPQRGAQSDPGGSLPQRGAQPDPAGSLPQRGAHSDPGGSLPQRGAQPDPAGSLPQRGGPLPQRGGSSDGPGVLPRRTTRTRPSGRHRSPHRLSVASEAPALVLAVPGTAAADTEEIGPRVASIAELSCPGVDIRVGYVQGTDLSLVDCLLPDNDSDEPNQFPSVIVPLLLGPSPAIDAALISVAAQPPVPAVVADHLGPHPLVAEALHARLAEAGLARHARATGLSISADRRGIIVLADKDEQAASAAAVAAVLLASRLSVPVVPASLGDPASIADAVTRLSDSGAQPALAPCLIGPETSLPVLNDLSSALGAPTAAPLGAHQAVGQLVAIRYGAALATLTLAG